MIVKLLTEHHLKFISLKVGCRGSSESTFVKISNCWKSHAAAHIVLIFCCQDLVLIAWVNFAELTTFNINTVSFKIVSSNFNREHHLAFS